MPVQHLLSAPGKPVPLHFLPQLLDILLQGCLLRICRVQVLPHGEKSLYEVGGLHQISAIVFGTERYGNSGRTIQPVRPGTVIALGSIFQESDHFFPALHTLGTGDETALDSHNHRHYPEAGSSGGHYVAG